MEGHIEKTHSLNSSCGKCRPFNFATDFTFLFLFFLNSIFVCAKKNYFRSSGIYEVQIIEKRKIPRIYLIRWK